MEHSILLAPEARSKGLGRALMLALCDHARAAGAHQMIAGVSAENPDGVAFHARMGFSEIARVREAGRKFGRFIDLVLMQKFL
jgi:phosphinothricin acetyltransferase